MTKDDWKFISMGLLALVLVLILALYLVIKHPYNPNEIMPEELERPHYYHRF
ncbi:MAG: hypothetical protein ABFD79_11960 [Phycisphaerales bacterium]